MSFLQAIRLLDLQNVMEANAPGDPRLWDVLNDSLGGIHVQLMNCLCLEWDEKPDRIPSLEEWTDWMSLEGNLGVSVSNQSETYTLQKRKRGFLSHPIESLVWDWMEMQGYELPQRLWLCEHYVISVHGDPARVFDSLRGLMALGSKSGIWDENTEECRLLSPNEELSWPYEFEAEVQSLRLSPSKFLESINLNPNLLSSRFALTENTGRGTPAATVCESISELWQTVNPPKPKLPESKAKAPAGPEILNFLGPKHFIVGLPKNAQFERIGENLRAFIEEHAALSDRYPGVIRFREASSTILHLESFPETTSRLNELNVVPQSGKAKRLFMIQPWDARNPVMARRIENFLDAAPEELLANHTIFPGTLNWVQSFLHSIINASGWKIPETSAMSLLAWNAMRVPTSSLFFFWSSLDVEDVKSRVMEFGLRVQACGEATQSNAFVVGEQTVPVVEISFEEIRNRFAKSSLVTAQWVYKDQKSPTYGFEKAAVFPDRFLKRVSQSGVRTDIQKSISWNMSSNPAMRDHVMKNRSNQPITYMRWSDGEETYLDSIASVDGIAEYDPKALGEWTVDLALRGLICKGVDPAEPVFLQAWMGHPDATDQPSSSERYGAFYLANQGLKKAVEDFSMTFGGASFCGSYSRSRPYVQELVVRTRARLGSNLYNVFPGFRMAGETLYVLGPKPAFMDAGSRILPHFRVVSNHVSKLNIEAQSELYARLHECIASGLVTVARPIGQGGLLGALLEMALWGSIGVLIKPGLSTIELFSGAPGRIVVGVLPQEAKRFEALFRSELIAAVGESSGDRIFGQPLSFYRDTEGVPNVLS